MNLYFKIAIVNKCRCVIKGVPFNQSLFNCFVEFDGFIKSEASVCFSKMCFFITGVIIVFAIAIVIVGDVQKQQQKSGISEKMIKLCFSWFFKYIVVVAVVINVNVVVVVVVVVGAARFEPNRCMRGLGRCCLGGSQAGGDRKRRRV